MKITLILLVIGLSLWVRKESVRTCPLTYDINGAISEAQMIKWSADAGWSFTHPTWNGEGCSCDDADPTQIAAQTTTPVWIAPCDLRALFPDVIFPSDFPTSSESCEPKDHIKVCLPHIKLNQLWNGLNASGVNVGGLKHCHDTDSIYTGWDGDIYCTATCPTEYSSFQVDKRQQNSNPIWIGFEINRFYSSYSCIGFTSYDGEDIPSNLYIVRANQSCSAQPCFGGPCPLDNTGCYYYT